MVYTDTRPDNYLDNPMSDDETELFLDQLRDYAARHGRKPPYFLDQTIRQRLREQMPQGPLSWSTDADETHHSEVFREQLKAYAESHPRTTLHIVPTVRERFPQDPLASASSSSDVKATTAAGTAPPTHTLSNIAALARRWWHGLLDRKLDPAFIGAVASIGVVAITVLVVMQTSPPSPFISAHAQLQALTANEQQIDILAQPDTFGSPSTSGSRDAAKPTTVVAGARLGLEIAELELLNRLDSTRITADHFTALANLLQHLPETDDLAGIPTVNANSPE